MKGCLERTNDGPGSSWACSGSALFILLQCPHQPQPVCRNFTEDRPSSGGGLPFTFQKVQLLTVGGAQAQSAYPGQERQNWWDSQPRGKKQKNNSGSGRRMVGWDKMLIILPANSNSKVQLLFVKFKELGY